MRTFGYVALALQAQGVPDSGTGGVDFVHLIASANWLVKSVLLILVLFSAVSWGIILYKVWQYRRAERDIDEVHELAPNSGATHVSQRLIKVRRPSTGAGINER